MFTQMQRDIAYRRLLEHDNIERENQVKIFNDFMTHLKSGIGKEYSRLAQTMMASAGIISHLRNYTYYMVSEYVLRMPYLKDYFFGHNMELRIDEHGELHLTFMLSESLRLLSIGCAEVKTLFITPDDVERLWVEKYGDKQPF